MNSILVSWIFKQKKSMNVCSRLNSKQTSDCSSDMAVYFLGLFLFAIMVLIHWLGRIQFSFGQRFYFLNLIFVQKIFPITCYWITCSWILEVLTKQWIRSWFKQIWPKVSSGYQNNSSAFHSFISIEIITYSDYITNPILCCMSWRYHVSFFSTALSDRNTGISFLSKKFFLIRVRGWSSIVNKKKLKKAGVKFQLEDVEALTMSFLLTSDRRISNTSGTLSPLATLLFPALLCTETNLI